MPGEEPCDGRQMTEISGRMANSRGRQIRRIVFIGGALAALIGAGFVGGASSAPARSASLTYTLINKAPVDECFAGIGVPYPAGPPCPAGSTPKANGAYLWSMV